MPLTVIPLLYCAKKYMVKTLEKKCSHYLHSLISAETACLILDQSLLYDQKELVRKSQQLIQMHSYEAFHSEAFMNISQRALCVLLSLPSFSCAEVEVFQACIQWGQHRCSVHGVNPTGTEIRTFLGAAIFRVHFGSFSREQFLTEMGKTAVLTAEESHELWSCVESGNRCAFTTAKRDEYCNFPIRYKFIPTYGMMQRHPLKEIYITFVANSPILLKQLAFDLENYKRSEFNVTVTTDDGQICRGFINSEEGFLIKLGDMRVETGIVVKVELFVRSMLPITLVVQNSLKLDTEVKQLNTKLELTIVDASRGAGSIFKYIDVTPLAV